MRKVYTIGETVLDILFKGKQPFAAKAGGSCLNSAVTLGRLGLPVCFISEFANDEVGNIIDAFLKENNVSTEYVYRYSEGKSSLALAFLNDKLDASYEFYKLYPHQRLVIDFPVVCQDDIILFGSFYAITPEIRTKLIRFISEAKQKNAIVIYDPNFRKQHLDELHILKPLIEENISFATIVRGSHEDFSFIYGAGNADETFKAMTEKSLCLLYTNSSSGVFLRTDKLSNVFPVKKTEVKSTIGAGDNFNAGVAYSLYRNNITYNDLQDLNLDIWRQIVETAVEFATHVCESYENYISIEFAEKFKMK